MLEQHFASSQNNVRGEDRKCHNQRDCTDRDAELSLPRRIHTNNEATFTSNGWAGEEEVEEQRFVCLPEVTQGVTAKATHQLLPLSPSVLMLPDLFMSPVSGGKAALIAHNHT